MTISPRPSRRAFTLVELLVVIAIIAVLMALTIPTYKAVMDKSQASQCVSNLRQIYAGTQLWSTDNGGRSMPGRYDASPAKFWMNYIRPYVGGTNEWPPGQREQDAVLAKLRCPLSKPGTRDTYGSWKGPGNAEPKNYWAWGYGMNSCPGYEGADSTAYDKYFNWEPPDPYWKRTYEAATITRQSQRLFFCDSIEWQVTPGASSSAFPSHDRHGKDVCNVLYYDGHVAATGSLGVLKALYDPGR